MRIFSDVALIVNGGWWLKNTLMEEA